MAVATELMKRGLDVSFPFGNSLPYDLILDDCGELYKVQVKRAFEDERGNGTIQAELRSRSYRKGGEIKSTEYDSDGVDAYAIYWPEDDDVFWVPFEDAGDTKINIKLTDPDEMRPCEIARCRMADDFRLSEYFTVARQE